MILSIVLSVLHLFTGSDVLFWYLQTFMVEVFYTQRRHTSGNIFYYFNLLIY